MPETALVLPVLAILLPGVLAYRLGREAGRIWPGVILACAAIGWGGWLVYQSAGAAANDAKAAFTLAAPAAMSALVGTGFARLRKARAT